MSTEPEYFNKGDRVVRQLRNGRQKSICGTYVGLTDSGTGDIVHWDRTHSPAVTDRGFIHRATEADEEENRRMGGSK